MMGAVLSPEMQAKVDEQVAARKAKVAASLGKTVEEFDAAQHAHSHAHEDGCGCGCGHEGHDHEHGDAGAEEAPEVDEQAVLAFIHSRQSIIEEQRSRIRALEAQVRHVENQRDLAEKKCATLRDALAKTREELKAAKAPTE